MNRLFGSKPTGPKPTLTGAISGLDERVDALDVKIAKLNAELSAIQQKVANMRDGPGKTALKRKALTVFQRRKQYEGQKDQLQQQSWNMEQASMMQDNLKSAWWSFFVIVVCCVAAAPWEYYVKYSGSSFRLASLWEEGWPGVEEVLQGLVELPRRLLVGAVVLAAAAMVLTVLTVRSMLIYGRAARGMADVMVTVDALKTTNKELKKQYGRIDIDKIERLQDEMADLMDVGNDIQAAMSQAYDIPDDVDEEELDAEFEVLAGEMQMENELGGLEGGLPSYLQPETLPEFVDAPIEEGKGKEAVKEGGS